jgi:DNA-binding NarL/FixJ family response regulator
MVNGAPDMTVLGEAGNGAEAVALARQHHPDVVLMDIRMPVLDGIEATRAITTDPDTAGARVLILTTFDLDDYVYRALRAGASGFLLKDTAPEELLAAIRTLAVGDALLAPGITRRLIREFAARPEPEERPSPNCSNRSPPASAKCWPRWPAAGRTPRSASACPGHQGRADTASNSCGGSGRVAGADQDSRRANR